MPRTDVNDSLVTRNLTVEDALRLGDATTLALMEMAAPATPPPGEVHVFAGEDGGLHAINDTGTVLDLTAGPVAHRTLSRMIYIEDPAATDVFPLGFVPHDVTLSAVRGVTDQGTVDFNIEHRPADSPDEAGTDILTGDLTADDEGASSTDFAAAGVSGGRWLTYAASAVSGSPGKLWVVVTFVID